MTHPNARAAHAANGAIVAYVLTRLESDLAKHGHADPMRGFISYGSLRVERCDAEATNLVPRSPWQMLPVAHALAQAVIDTHETTPLILCFANTSWRLLIACRPVTMPGFGDGASFGSIAPESNRALLARLHAQPFGKGKPDPTALRSWQSVIAGADDDGMRLFLQTALAHSLPITTLPPGAALSTLSECEDPLTDDDGEQP